MAIVSIFSFVQCRAYLSVFPSKYQKIALSPFSSCFDKNVARRISSNIDGKEPFGLYLCCVFTYVFGTLARQAQHQPAPKYSIEEVCILFQGEMGTVSRTLVALFGALLSYKE